MDELLKQEREIKKQLLEKEREFNELFNKNTLDNFKILNIKEDMVDENNENINKPDDEKVILNAINELILINKKSDTELDPYQKNKINNFFKNYNNKIPDRKKKIYKEKLANLIYNRFATFDNFEEKFNKYSEEYNKFLHIDFLMDRKREYAHQILLDVTKKMNYLTKTLKSEENNYNIFNKEYIKNDILYDKDTDIIIKNKKKWIENNLNQYNINKVNDITLTVDEFLKNN